MKITASDLYAYVSCPHRIYRDAHDDPRLRDPVNEFVQLLWERGTQYEKEVLERHKASGVEALDLSHERDPVERERKTLDAMRNKVPYIIHGRISADDLLGEPDLLELQPDGNYAPVDIKSGMGSKDGGDDESDDKSGELKKHYALQLGLYIDILRRLGFTALHFGRIWDSRGMVVDYDLSQPRTKKQTWLEYYAEVLHDARNIIGKRSKTTPALSSTCNLCVWRTDCKNWCVNNHCVSLVPELGRSRKDDIAVLAKTLDELAAINPADHIDAKGKTNIPQIGEKRLVAYSRRAKLLTSGSREPVILEHFELPTKPIELFFDIEADPTQDIVYLHGVVERRNGDDSTRKFRGFTAKEVSAGAERDAWAEFWEYIRKLPEDAWLMYYYSKYERTQYRSLAHKFPAIASEAEVEWLFDTSRSIDLYYDIIKSKTEWPAYNQSIKTLAQHLGFSWRDLNPSGAASIQWFNEYCREKDPAKLQRILDYNEDDCVAMIIVKDKLSRLLNN